MKKITHDLKNSVYFAHPYCSHERARIENTNGLLRQYLPKGISFENLSQINSTPLSMKSTTNRESLSDTEHPSRSSRATSLHLNAESAIDFIHLIAYNIAWKGRDAVSLSPKDLIKTEEVSCAENRVLR